jgi:GNAT superfamily N-acetyltransferase
MSCLGIRPLADALFSDSCQCQSDRTKKRKEIKMQNLIPKQAGQTRSQRPQIEAQYEGTGPDMRAVSIRVATADDKEKLRRMFSRLSAKSVYQRFHLPYSEVPEQVLALILDMDHCDKKSLVALVEEEIIAHVMYARLGASRNAEVAFVVEDGWQSKGVGKLLLSQIAEEARLRGVETFTGEVLGENRRVLSLLNAVFAEVEYVIRDGLYHFRVPLQTLKVTGNSLQTVNSLQILRRAA